jgi:cytochrome subunit of sulfide dehydrogenase
MSAPRFFALTGGALTMVACIGATAAGHAPDPTRVIAAGCGACHGTDGSGEGGLPVLAGRDRTALATALAEYKAGTRPATVMHQHAKGYSDAQLEQLAAWFAALPAPKPQDAR